MPRGTGVKITAVIVDDEELARAVLREYLSGHPDIEIVAECSNGFEAVKAVSDLYSPVSGSIAEVNKELAGTPELVNRDPYGKGWMVKIRLTNPDDLKGLLDAAAYKALLGK